jgi:hypothetical protein
MKRPLQHRVRAILHLAIGRLCLTLGYREEREYSQPPVS